MKLINVSKKLFVSIGLLSVAALGHAQVGIQTDQPSEMLDVAEQGVRIRNINTPTYEGNVQTDKLVVATNDGVKNGVLKTVAYPSPKLLSGGKNAFAFSNGGVTVSAVSPGWEGSGAEDVVATNTFTIDKPSLVQISYSLSMEVTGTYDGTPVHSANEDGTKLMGSGIVFTAVPAGFTDIATGYYQYQSGMPYAFARGTGVGVAYGYFYTNGSPSFKLAPGTYTIELRGFVYSPPRDDDGIRVRFSGAPSGAVERLDIVAYPYPTE